MATAQGLFFILLVHDLATVLYESTLIIIYHGLAVITIHVLPEYYLVAKTVAAYWARFLLPNHDDIFL